MRALVLVGGQGTRLRPLTDSLPKALVPIGGEPLVERLLRHLRAHGIVDVTFAASPNNEPIEAQLGDGSQRDMRLQYRYETEPAGSGGAIRLAAARWREPFLVLNGDILCDVDLGAFASFHREHQARVSIALVEVDDPSRYGVALTRSDGRITRFVEKPSSDDVPSRWINAGIWLLEAEVLDAIPAEGFTRVEDDLFPALAESGSLLGFRHGGSWVDIGTPESYWAANMEVVRSEEENLLHVDATAQVAPSAELCGPLALGSHCVLEAGAAFRRSVAWAGVHIGAGAKVERSILAEGVSVGPGVSLEGVVVSSGAQLRLGEEPRPPLTALGD